MIIKIYFNTFISKILFTKKTQEVMEINKDQAYCTTNEIESANPIKSSTKQNQIINTLLF